MTNKLRVAVIGAGRWSAEAHLPGWQRSPLCDLVVICDLDKDLAARRAKQFGAAGIETDYRKVLAREDIDVVDIVKDPSAQGSLAKSTTLSCCDS